MASDDRQAKLLKRFQELMDQSIASTCKTDELTDIINNFSGEIVTEPIDHTKLIRFAHPLPESVQRDYIFILFQIDPADYLLRELRIMERPSFRNVMLITDIILFVNSFYLSPIHYQCCMQLYSNAKRLAAFGITIDKAGVFINDFQSLTSTQISYCDFNPNGKFKSIHKVADGIYSVSLENTAY